MQIRDDTEKLRMNISSNLKIHINSGQQPDLEHQFTITGLIKRNTKIVLLKRFGLFNEYVCKFLFLTHGFCDDGWPKAFTSHNHKL